ncbi:MAG: SOS response-associated peptidase [Polyangiaceae bacterium]|nr:SOS response-associated peptidase [Polyangiaceae bacterium]
MCGRYSNTAELSEIALTFDADVSQVSGWRPTYNISPSWGPGFEQLIVVAPGEAERSVRLARFWLIPKFWKKPLKELPTAFNARSEDIERRAFFRESLRAQRCLIPATGWREFVGNQGKKQPFHFRSEAPLFAFAGLWSSWVSPEGVGVDTFAIITTAPGPTARAVHDRMPLAMPPTLYGDWLGNQVAPEACLEEAIQVSLSAPLSVYASDPIGNNPRFEGPEVLKAAPQPQQGALFGATVQRGASSKTKR